MKALNSITPSKRAKQLGAHSLKQVAEVFGCTPDNLKAKFKAKPHQFDIIVLGVVEVEKANCEALIKLSSADIEQGKATPVDEFLDSLGGE